MMWSSLKENVWVYLEYKTTKLNATTSISLVNSQYTYFSIVAVQAKNIDVN